MRYASLPAIFLAFMMQDGMAQSVSRIADVPQCAGCRLEFELQAVLGDLDGGGALARDPAVVLPLRNGQWIVAEYLGTDIAVFAANGSFIRRVGRIGEGPGEFGQIGAGYVDVNTGHLHIFDGQTARVTVLDPDANFEVVQTKLMPPGVLARAVQDRHGTVFYNAEVTPRDAIGYPLHLFDGREFVRSFGITTPVYRPDAPWLFQRALAPAAQGGIWAARRTEYRLEHWTTSGTNSAVWERHASWFQPYVDRRRATPENPPQPWVAGVTQLSDSILAVAVKVSTPDFSRRLQVREVTPRGPIYDLDDCGTLFDTIIELVDVKNGTVLSRQRHEECIHGFPTSEFAYSYGLTHDAVPQIRVYRLRYVDPSTPK